MCLGYQNLFSAVYVPQLFAQCESGVCGICSMSERAIDSAVSGRLADGGLPIVCQMATMLSLAVPYQTTGAYLY